MSGSENLTSTAAPAAEIPADLLAIARRVDGEINAPIAGTPEAEALERAQKLEADVQAIPLEQELAGMFAMAGAGLGVWLPRTGAVLTKEDPETKKSGADRLGEALAPVARKYGLDRYLAGFAWRVELNALMVAGPIAAAIVQAARLDIAELRARELEARGQAPALSNDELELRAIAAVEKRTAELAAAQASTPVAALKPVAMNGVPVQ